jgi:hypothetical protein
MILELQKATRLNLHFAQQCLMESGWDLQKALQGSPFLLLAPAELMAPAIAFQTVAAQIPPEAFV